MDCTLLNVEETLLIAPGELHELVRGQEHEFVARLTPIVLRQSVALDCRRVERIDAAGIAALISLYGAAHGAGNNFVVTNAAPRVAEILRVVGLDRILIAQDADASERVEVRFSQPAA